MATPASGSSFNPKNWKLPEVVDEALSKAKKMVGLQKQKDFFPNPADSAKKIDKKVTQQIGAAISDSLLMSPLKMIRSSQLNLRLDYYAYSNSDEDETGLCKELKDRLVKVFNESENTKLKAGMELQLDLSKYMAHEFPLEIFKMPEFQREDIVITLPVGFAAVYDTLPDQIGNLTKVVGNMQVQYQGSTVAGHQPRAQDEVSL